jgi:hypothetical protein
VGEELCYDYAYDRTDDMGEEEERMYICRCGAPTCRGTILAPLEEQQEEPPKKAPVKASKKKSSKTSTRKPPATRKQKSAAKSGRSGSGAGSKNRARTRAARG